jgi:hypothetical protein
MEAGTGRGGETVPLRSGGRSLLFWSSGAGLLPASLRSSEMPRRPFATISMRCGLEESFCVKHLRKGV